MDVDEPVLSGRCRIRELKRNGRVYLSPAATHTQKNKRSNAARRSRSPGAQIFLSSVQWKQSKRPIKRDYAMERVDAGRSSCGVEKGSGREGTD